MIKSFHCLVILLLVISCHLLAVPASATDEFAVAYDITYEVEVDGNAKVVTDIALTNKLSNVYATEYNLVIEKGEISQIGAWDAKGEIGTEIKTEGDQTKINLKFNDQIVGVDKTLRFTLKYEIANLAKKSGEIWQIILPKQASPEKLADFKVSLKVPKNFPALAFVSPEPFNQQQSKDFVQYFFNKESLTEKGVVAVFGQCQIFDFTLSYHLANPKNEPVFSKIALPPTTSYQRVAYFNLKPKPENVEVDEDGNWLAKYLLSAKEEKEVITQGQVQIYAEPQELHEEPDFKKYLLSQPFWEIDDPKIKKLAGELKTPRAIYNNVIATLSYDFEKIKSKQERMGAAKALEYPNQAICMEFTDLFIALVRAAGIPAREINGFAYTENPQLKPLSQSADILHSWPEYWDNNKKRWVPVDPTWEKTSGINYFDKMDLSHFVFAIHGQNSQYPAAAGSYKKASQTQKDIQIKFGVFKEKKDSQLKAQFLLPKSFFGERGVKGKVVLENLGPNALYNLSVKLQAEHLDSNSLGVQTLEVLPPFAKKEIPIVISSSWRPKKAEAKIALLANNQTFSYNMMANSLILNFVLPAVGGIAVGGSLLIFILKIRK